ncbi:MAG: CpsD/CapB family tyrosine-protein kinase [Paracoccaceae bacterium]
MQNDYMLMQRTIYPADVELSAMSDDQSDTRRPNNLRGISLFRTGQSPARMPVTLDQATGRDIFSAPLPEALLNPAKVWESLAQVTLKPDHLTRNGLFPTSSDNPAASAFDVLRSRLLLGLAEKGWRRIAVTSPTHGCGKSFVATNLALSLARRPDSRTVLLDLDLRRPQLAGLLGVQETGPLQEYLSGEQPLESQFRRVGRTLALGLNGTPVPEASELLHDPETGLALQAMADQLDPQVVILDLPPVLVNDDVLAMANHVDAVLLVTDGTKTSPEEIRASERLLDGRLPLLGVVLNRAQDRKVGRYRYGRD